MGMPHLPQNFVEGGYRELQRGQVTISAWLAGGTTRGALMRSKFVLPQRPQNLAPAAKRA
jgi:hypothetical protein